VILLCVWDGLRPDFMRADLTPTLCAFSDSGVKFGAHRSVFPTETRVNSSSIATGCYPDRHGIVGNRFYTRDLDGTVTDTIDTGNHEDLERLRTSAGSILGVPTLAALLRRAGKEVAVVGAGSPGSTLLQDPEDPSWLVNTRGVVYPSALGADVGALPGSEGNGAAWNDAACDIFTSRIRGGGVDFGVLWLCDPDWTQHQAGLGSKPSIEAIRHNDARLAMLLGSVPKDTTVFVASDHGFSTVEGDPLGTDWIARAGLDQTKVKTVSNGSVFDTPNDVDRGFSVLVSDSRVGGLFSRNPQREDAFGYSDVRLSHPARSPDLYYSSAWDGGENEYKVRGRVFGPRSLATHGSLSPFDLSSVLIAAGPGLKRGLTTKIPSGVVDIAPTVLSLLGQPADGMDGRILSEACVDGPDPDQIQVERFREVREAGGFTRYLEFTVVDGHRYLMEGGIQDS
jgi:arylsulfatase A-like enzyme